MGDFENPLVTKTSDGPCRQGTSGGAWSYAGRNIHFGIREHAMTSIVTGMALHGGVLPFCATFMTFSDYMRPGIRLAALSAARVIYVWTHDSIALGEDGPTHQPIEQLASLRAIPHLTILRPADATETAEAWRVAMQHKGPVGLVLTRQKLPTLDRTALTPAAGVAGGLCAGRRERLTAPGDPDRHRLRGFAGPGGASRLATEQIRSRVVSMPSWELFEAQPKSYRDEVLPPAIRARVSIEAASPFGWERYVGLDGAIIGINRFGASAPGPIVMHELGFTAENVVAAAKAVIGKKS